MEQGQENKNLDQFTFDLADKEDRTELLKKVETNSNYFKPESDVTYKVTLNSTKITEVEKNFEGEKITKYAIDVNISNKQGEIFSGLWEVGKSILETIAKNYEPGAVFKITKTGNGKNTRYSVVADF